MVGISNAPSATSVAHVFDQDLRLACKECGRRAEAAPLHVCDSCFGPLEVSYDYQRITPGQLRAEIESGPRRCGATGACCQLRPDPRLTWTQASPGSVRLPGLPPSSG